MKNLRGNPFSFARFLAALLIASQICFGLPPLFAQTDTLRPMMDRAGLEEALRPTARVGLEEMLADEPLRGDQVPVGRHFEDSLAYEFQKKWAVTLERVGGQLPVLETQIDVSRLEGVQDRQLNSWIREFELSTVSARAVLDILAGHIIRNALDCVDMHFRIATQGLIAKIWPPRRPRRFIPSC